MPQAPRKSRNQVRREHRQAVADALRRGESPEHVSRTTGMKLGWVHSLAASEGIPVVRRLHGSRLRGFLHIYGVKLGSLTAALSGSDEDFVAWLVQGMEPGDTLADTLVRLAHVIHTERKGEQNG